MSRHLYCVVAALVLWAGCGSGDPLHQQANLPATSPKTPEGPMVSVHVFDGSGELVGPITTDKVIKTEVQWRSQLSDQEYTITREAGTERAFCGTLLDNKLEGVYACVCCSLPLFSSDSKFKSGTGWPSFFQPIAKGNVAERKDTSFGMTRIEVNCERCDAHLGHVFEDGPRPTGLRYCLNSESLVFTESGSLALLADPAAKKVAEVELKEGEPAKGESAKGAQAKVPGQPRERAEAVFAGGCFWCVEAVFEELEGVVDAVSGYAGGTAETANYEAVCSGRSGHAEVVKIIYDPATITYEELLRVHFATHDPTTLNRQGADKGTQYRSAIFYADDKERKFAEAFIETLTEEKVFSGAIVTELEPLKKFYPAEKVHQNYVCNNPNQGYVRGVALPKVEKVRKKFSDKLKSESPLKR